MSDLYKTIQEMCKAKHISVTKMCKEADIHRNVMGNLRSGRTKVPSTETLYKLSKYFNVPPSFFLDLGEPDPKDIPSEPVATDDQIIFAFWGKNPHNMNKDDLDRLRSMARLMEIERAQAEDEQKKGAQN